ncbi:hypothetical protein [Nocardia sp. NPDC052566]|uniref:hypothetical protein n=1 Tax=Nocardia sp. NPDC052566 TaxID=3364330 RepID=UPI0037CAFD98
MMPGPNEQPGRYAPRPEIPDNVPEIPDSARTTRNNAGEALEDSRQFPGVVVLLLGLVAVALTLTAAGYGFAGWAVVGVIASVLLIGAGTAFVVLEHRRLRAREGEELRGH